MNRNLLIVEDDGDVGAQLSKVLADVGFTVQTAESGLSGLDLLESGKKPFLILLNLVSPVMNSFDFLKHLRGKPYNNQIPVLALGPLGIQKLGGVHELLRIIQIYCCRYKEL